MGGYAAYVWPAYGLAAIGMIGILVFTRRTLKAREREFETLKNARRGGRE
jgi:heme exporter protein D